MTTQITEHMPVVHLDCPCVFPDFDLPVPRARCENMTRSKRDGFDLCGMPIQGPLALTDLNNPDATELTWAECLFRGDPIGSQFVMSQRRIVRSIELLAMTLPEIAKHVTQSV